LIKIFCSDEGEDPLSKKGMKRAVALIDDKISKAIRNKTSTD
jgi:hypothetical protein